MAKYKSLKEIHRFLIKNNMLHSINWSDINKKKLLKEFEKECNNEILPAFVTGAKYTSEKPHLEDFNEF